MGFRIEDPASIDFELSNAGFDEEDKSGFVGFGYGSEILFENDLLWDNLNLPRPQDLILSIEFDTFGDLSKWVFTDS